MSAHDPFCPRCDQWRNDCLCPVPPPTTEALSAAALGSAIAARLRAFGVDCVTHGDMTPQAKRMLDRIADEIQGDTR